MNDSFIHGFENIFKMNAKLKALLIKRMMAEIRNFSYKKAFYRVRVAVHLFLSVGENT